MVGTLRCTSQADASSGQELDGLWPRVLYLRNWNDTIFRLTLHKNLILVAVAPREDSARTPSCDGSAAHSCPSWGRVFSLVPLAPIQGRRALRSRESSDLSQAEEGLME